MTLEQKRKTKWLSEILLDGTINDRFRSSMEKLAGYLFRKISFNNESREIIKEYSDKGATIYASYHTSNLALLIFNNVLKKEGFKSPVFALESSPFLLQPIGYVLKKTFQQMMKWTLRIKSRYILDTDHDENLIKVKKTIVLSTLSRRLFIKRYANIKYDTLIYLIDVQRKIEFPIYIFPQMIFWNMNPERTKSIVSSRATGDRGLISGWLTILKSRTPAFIRISNPINLKEEIENSETDKSNEIAVAIRKKLLEIYNHNVRTVLGPVIKSKHEMMEQVLYHSNVLNEIKRLAKEMNVSEKKLRKDAYKYYREIAADFSIIIVKYFARSLDFVFEKIFNGIHYDVSSLNKIREAAKKGPLVFLPSHRSHMDYLIVSYILFKNRIIPPHIVAGINLSFFGIGYLFRHSGAFFIRRSFKGLELYPVVFKQYLKTLITEQYSIEFFIEGGRTRTGKLGFPKLGVLRYIIEAIEDGYTDDVIFIPVTVNYERILEENAYQKELQGSEKEKESLSAVVKARKFLKKKYGRVYVVFDDVVSYNEIIKNSKVRENENIINLVADTVINKINEITVVTAISLASATMLILSDKGFSKKLLVEKFRALYNYLSFFNINMSATLQNEKNHKEIIEGIIESYQEDNIIEELVINDKDRKLVVEDLFILRDDNRIKIRFYKNCIIQYLLPVSFVSLAILKECRSVKIDKESLENNYMFLKGLFSKEFIYSDDIKKSNNKCRTAYEFLISRDIISEDNNTV